VGLSDPSTAVPIEGLRDANPIGGIAARFSPIRFLLTGAAPSSVYSWQRLCTAPLSKKVRFYAERLGWSRASSRVLAR
jgi:hypothetical protein